MPRPRVHDIDDLLDAAQRLFAEGGVEGLTLRALASAAGVSNGSIYHAFVSKEELVARLWLRGVGRCLDVLEGRVTAGLARLDSHQASAADVVVSVASAVVEFAAEDPTLAALFFLHPLDALRQEIASPQLQDAFDAVAQRFTAILLRLADAMWGRRDRVAVETIACCVVDLPSGLLRRQLRGNGVPSPETARRLAAAAHAVLELPVPASRRTSTKRSTRKEARHA